MGSSTQSNWKVSYYVLDVPQNLISTNKWSEERQSNCGILSRRRYSVFIWDNNKAQTLVPHPVFCGIPIMKANEGGTKNLTISHKTATTAFMTRRRGEQNRLRTADKKIQPEQEDLQETQQPTFETSYHPGMTVEG
eukprot:3467976-Ditylum_brightwellii.AAC.3